MNYDGNEDELERMRARNRRGTRRTDSAPGRQAQTRRPAASAPGMRQRREEDYSYDEEYGEEEYGRDTYARNSHNRDSYGRNSNRQDSYDRNYDDRNYGGRDYNDRNQEGFGYDEYGYDEEEDGFDDIIIDDEPRNSRADRQSGARSQTRSARSGKRVSQAGNTSRKTQKNAKTGRREGQQEDIYSDSNGRSRDASGRRNQGQMAKRRKKKKWKSILLLLLVALIGYGAWLFLHRPTGIWNVAVFGVDSRDGNTKNALADVQMICSINRSTGEIKLVSVYRDTYLKINSEGTYHKINEAYFKGGQKQGVAALEENLDLKIDDYATFNWKSVAEAINILGGIDLEITQAEFNYINGFITETVNSTGIGSVQLTQPGMNHLDGVQAVAYSRLRLMDTDFQRTERQRKVVQLALDKAKAADVSTLTALATYMIPQISTSVGADDVLPLVKDIKKYHIGETAGFPFSRQTMRVGKMDCVIPTTLESNVVLLHQFLYGEDTSYSPSSAVKKISARISEETGLYEEGKVAPSGGSSSGGSSGGKAPAPAAPVETAPPETLPVEESTQESTQETTAEETQTTEEETDETKETEEIGPGISTKPAAPDKTKEETKEEENGPGTEESTKPSEKPSTPPSTAAPETAEPGTGPGSSASGPGTGGPGEAGPGI